MDYLLLTVSAFLLAINFSINKTYQKQKGTSFRAGFGFNALLGLFTAAIFFALNGFTLHITWYSLLMGMASTVFCVGYSLLGFRIMKKGSMAIYTLFLMAGGMTVPYLFGILFLDEPYSWARTAGLILIAGGIVLSNLPKKNERFSPVLLILCIAVFLLNGGTSVVSKLHQIESELPTVSTTEFVILGGLCKFTTAGTLFLLGNAKAPDKGTKGTESWKILLLIISAATVDGISYFLQLRGAASLPATVLYPFITGGSIVFTALADRILFKTRLSIRLILGITVCFIGTLLFL